jgi:two-component system sensor histidine kinase BaeS
MRSLMLKLTLAFVLVGLTGAILVAVLVGLRTRSEFDRFRAEHDQSLLVEALGNYYAINGDWDGVGEMLRTSPIGFSSRSLALSDAQGLVLLGNHDYAVGQTVPASALSADGAIVVNGQAVGYALFPAPGEQANQPHGPPPPEVRFLDQVTWASAISAGIATLIALLLGLLLARTLTRPVRELTAATQAMARGKLNQRVTVHARDEIGELATSFNQMSADLNRASQLRKQMTADLAHDLRTPLSILRGYTEGLKDGRLQGAPKLYTIMHGEVEHLQRLVEDLRVLSLADAGELPLNRRAVDPAALLERTGLAYIDQAERHGVALRVEAPESLPSIAVDTDRMTQVLNNLVSNALRYTTQGAIVLAAAVQGQHVQIQVRDSGRGIDQEDLPFIFDRFYRADKARQRGDSAESGLGLAIAKAIVEAHAGTIAVASTPGAGTTFTLTFPVAPQPKAVADGELGMGARAV